MSGVAPHLKRDVEEAEAEAAKSVGAKEEPAAKAVPSSSEPFDVEDYLPGGKYDWSDVGSDEL
jgi:hypothetical protein